MYLKKRFLIGKARNQKGQVWVETVVYTLIAFTLMGLVLAFVVPKIQETQDRGIIEQSIRVLQDLDLTVKNLDDPGDQRVLELGLSKGSLTINATNDIIFFELESRYQYSQPGQNITFGEITANTQERGKINIITLTLNYAGRYNLTYRGGETEKTLTRAPVPYKVSISDEGSDSSGNPIIEIDVT